MSEEAEELSPCKKTTKTLRGHKDTVEDDLYDFSEEEDDGEPITFLVGQSTFFFQTC